MAGKKAWVVAAGGSANSIPDDDAVMTFPDDHIKATDKNDDDTQKVKVSIANCKDRAIGYLNGYKSEIIMAVDAFKDSAQNDIDAFDGDSSDGAAVFDALVAVVGGVVSAVFPPAAGFVAGATFVASMGKISVTSANSGDTASVKAALKKGMQDFAKKASDAASKAIAAESNKVVPRLNNLAATDKNVWNLLATGGDKERDTVVVQFLHIPDPARNSPYGKVMSALMGRFKAWVAKEKAEAGKTKYERMVEELPSNRKDLDKKMKDPEDQGEAEAKKMTADHEGDGDQ
jgi:hypothetical protein